jgi:hypothetical protein
MMMHEYVKRMCVILTLLVVHPVKAQDISIKGVHVSGGVIFPESFGTGFNFAAGIDLGELAKKVHISPLISYWKASKEDHSMSNFALALDMQYFISEPLKGAYLGVGMSYNFLSWDYSYIVYDPEQRQVWDETTENKIGFYPLLGYQRKIDMIIAFAEIKYHLISEFDTVQISIGAQWPL